MKVYASKIQTNTNQNNTYIVLCRQHDPIVTLILFYLAAEETVHALISKYRLTLQ